MSCKIASNFDIKSMDIINWIAEKLTKSVSYNFLLWKFCEIKR